MRAAAVSGALALLMVATTAEAVTGSVNVANRVESARALFRGMFVTSAVR